MAASLKASEKGIEIVDRARKVKGWNKYDPQWCTQAHTTDATLKRFWRRKEAISSDTFKSICQAVGVDWEEVVDRGQTTKSRIDFNAYKQEWWVGREALIEKLSHKINSASYRIQILLGITGIGKTALAEKTIENVRGSWNELRVNFENGNQKLDFVTVARQWLEKWGIPVPKEEQNAEQLQHKVIKQLRSNRYLILLDSLEYLLTGNEDEGWGDFNDPWWNSFFVSFLAEPNCASHIIITSQDIPLQFSREGDRYDSLWDYELIRGLEREEQMHLFQKAQLEDNWQSKNSPLRLIGEIYDGHPLALKTIAGEIKESWHGNVSAYWQEHSNHIEEVKKALEEARNQGKIEGKEDRWKLASYTQKLRLKVKQRLEITFQRLQNDVPDAYRLICLASNFRCETKERSWLFFLQCEGYSLQKQQEAIQALRNRYLVEDVRIDHQNERLVKQHNLVRSVAISHRLKLWGDDDADSSRIEKQLA